MTIVRRLDVIAVEDGAPAATIAENGLGAPVVLVEKNGAPLIITGLPEPDLEPEE